MADRCLGKQELDFLLQELADIINPDSSYNLIVCGSGALSLCYGINFGKTDDLDAFDVNLIDYPDELSESVLEISRRHPELHLKAHWLNDDIMRFASYSNEFGADDMRYVLNGDRTIQYQGRDEYGYETGGMITVTPVRLEGILLAKFSAYRPKDISHIECIMDLLGLYNYNDIIATFRTYISQSIERKSYWLDVDEHIREYCEEHNLEIEDEDFF